MRDPRHIGLKELAEHLGVSQGTVSMALSPDALAKGVAAKTRDRVLRAASELNYLPNYHARSLSSGRSYTIGVLVPAISEGYYSGLIAGMEEYLMKHNYCFLVTSHRFKPELLRTLPINFMKRGAEGIIVVNTALDGELALPSVRIGGSVTHTNSTNVRLNEEHGTTLALKHLVSLRHRNIAFIRGEPESTATEERWQGIVNAAAALKVEVDPRLTVQLKLGDARFGAADVWSGYSAAEQMIATSLPFTAIFAYNDSTAIGAMRALQDAGLRVPEDVSVLGYDDIPAAEHERPALTTIRQPLLKMGANAAKAMVGLIERKKVPKELLIEPVLVLRRSTAAANPAPSRKTQPRGRARAAKPAR